MPNTETVRVGSQQEWRDRYQARAIDDFNTGRERIYVPRGSLFFTYPQIPNGDTLCLVHASSTPEAIRGADVKLGRSLDLIALVALAEIRNGLTFFVNEMEIKPANPVEALRKLEIVSSRKQVPASRRLTYRNLPRDIVEQANRPL